MTPPELPWCTYIRTSTLEQGEKSSPLKQFMANIAWAKNNGHIIPGIETAISGNKVGRGDYIFVDHQSGTNDDRPDLQRFLALARSGKVGGVVCYVVDRAARNLADAVKLHRDLKRMRVDFKFAMQNFDDTAAGTMMFQIFSSFAEYEAKLILERTHDGRRKSILGQGKDGKLHVHGRPLFGYRLENGIPVKDAKEAPVALFFLRRALEGDTTNEIAAAMNAAGMPTRKGGQWLPTAISKWLRKAHSYAGVHRYQHGLVAAKRAHAEAVKLMGADAPALDRSAIETIETAAYPALITRDEANLILARAEKNREEKRGRPTIQYALSHYIWCAACNTRWYAKRGIYYCGCRQLGKPRCRAARTEVRQASLEAAVLDGMRAYLRRPEVHYALALDDYNATRGSAKRGRTDLEQAVRRTVKEQAHYDEQATEYGLSPKQRDIARKKSQALELKLAELNAELRQLSVVPLPSKTGIAAAFRQTLELLDRMATFDEKRDFVKLVVERVVTDGQQVTVTCTLAADVANTGTSGEKYSSHQLDAGLIKSASIPFTFTAPIKPKVA